MKVIVITYSEIASCQLYRNFMFQTCPLVSLSHLNIDIIQLAKRRVYLLSESLFPRCSLL